METNHRLLEIRLELITIRDGFNTSDFRGKLYRWCLGEVITILENLAFTLPQEYKAAYEAKVKEQSAITAVKLKDIINP